MLERLTILAMLLLCQWTAVAQQPATYYEKEARYAEAMDLYDKEKFSAAQKEFDHLRKELDDPYHELSVNAEYMTILRANG
jgi:outer membrane protein assembly factor BamD (BamD/ComL family)